MLTFAELERDRLVKELPEIPHLRCILWDITRIAHNGAGIALVAINNTLERKTRYFETPVNKLQIERRTRARPT